MTRKFGREFQHLEDLLYLEPTGLSPYTILSSINDQRITYKWDGNPTIYWGMNTDNKFVLVNKNAWGKKMCTSPGMLKSFIMSTGKGESWREEFADSLVEIWPDLEDSWKKTNSRYNGQWAQGYLYGDVLFYPRNPARIENNKVVFKPNKVEYRIDTDSPLGKNIKNSRVCIAVTKYYPSFGDAASISGTFYAFSGNVSTIPDVSVESNFQFDPDVIKNLQDLYVEYRPDILSFFHQTHQGLTDFPNIVYTYVNHKSKSGSLDTLGDDFIDWLPYSKTSVQKQAKILALHKSNDRALPKTFRLIKETMKLKDELIDHLDKQTYIEAYTGDKPGGEGYVLPRINVKLVPRHRWKPD